MRSTIEKRANCSLPPCARTLAKSESTLSDAEVLLNQNGNGVNPATSQRHKKEDRPPAWSSLQREDKPHELSSKQKLQLDF